MPRLEYEATILSMAQTYEAMRRSWTAFRRFMHSLRQRGNERSNGSQITYLGQSVSSDMASPKIRIGENPDQTVNGSGPHL